AALKLPPDARKEVDRELGRLERIGRESMETQVIRTYLETIAELPWNERTDEHLDLKAAAEILEADHYALGDVKDRVLEFLAVRQLKESERKAELAARAQHVEPTDGAGETGPTKTGEFERPRPTETAGNPDDKARGPILLFIGPPGVGKTSVAKSI